MAASSSDTGEIALAALLGALGLAAVGGVAYAASRRRRVPAPVFDEPVAYEPAIAEPVPTPATLEPAFTAPAYAAPVAAAPTASLTRTRAHGDPVALPAQMPATFEERDALLKELVAAEPDRANPFTGTRARARRAKLIMQSLGREFTNRKPRIDLSAYTNRWPSLRGWQPATA